MDICCGRQRVAKKNDVNNSGRIGKLSLGAELRDPR